MDSRAYNAAYNAAHKVFDAALDVCLSYDTAIAAAEQAIDDADEADWFFESRDATYDAAEAVELDRR